MSMPLPWCRRAALAAGLACAPLALAAQQAPTQPPNLPQQIADVMVQLAGGIHTGFRFFHAKGIVCTGTFTPARGAASISDELQRSLTYNPIYLTRGIELSSDPLVPLRSAVYGLSVAHRH